jgi:hypothetical protein
VTAHSDPIALQTLEEVRKVLQEILDIEKQKIAIVEKRDQELAEMNRAYIVRSKEYDLRLARKKILDTELEAARANIKVFSAQLQAMTEQVELATKTIMRAAQTPKPFSIQIREAKGSRRKATK